MRAWDDWYHCMSNTYGTWLPGDARGFRTENRKIDIPYDYKNPPPEGEMEWLHRRSKRLMSRPPVYLNTESQRQRVLNEVVGSLRRRTIEIAVAALDRIHLHVLARCRDRNPRKWVGLAKKESSHHCKATGDAPAGGLWGAGCECKPVRDRGHLENALDYIPRHANHGAVVHVDESLVKLLRNPLKDFDPNDLLVD